MAFIYFLLSIAQLLYFFALGKKIGLSKASLNIL